MERGKEKREFVLLLKVVNLNMLHLSVVTGHWWTLREKCKYWVKNKRYGQTDLIVFYQRIWASYYFLCVNALF